MIVLGIGTCDTCRKALRSLSDHAPIWRDIRKEPLSPEELDRILVAFGDRAVNRSSATWRGLSDQERTEPARDLLSRHPTLMKRPVIDDGETLHLGWTDEVRAALGI